MLCVKALVVIFASLKVMKCQNYTTDFLQVNDESLILATSEIIEKIFFKVFSTVNIIKATKDSAEGSDFINKLLLYHHSFIVRLDNNTNIKSIKTRKKRNNIIVLDDIESFRVLNGNLDSNIFSFRAYYLIVGIKGKIQATEEIFKTLWNKNIFNANVIYVNRGEVEVTTFLPFGNEVCGSYLPKVVGNFRNGSFRSMKAFYPNKFKNLRGCPLKIATFEEPLAIMKKSYSNGSFSYSGFDLDLVVEISKALNFKIDLKFFEGRTVKSKLCNNGTLSGVLCEIANHEAQISIGRYFLDVGSLNILDNSASYFSYPYVFVVSPARKLTNLEKLFHPFDRVVWFCFGILLITAIAVIQTLRCKLKRHQAFVFGTKIRHPLTNMLIVIVGSSQPKLPGRNFSRFLLMKFMIFCLVFRSAYQGSVYKFLQSDRSQKIVETIDELVEQKFNLYMHEKQRFLFENQPAVLRRFNLISV